MSRMESRPVQLGYNLPAPQAPVGNYPPAMRSGDLLFMAGVGSRGADGSRIMGKLGVAAPLSSSIASSRWRRANTRS